MRALAPSNRDSVALVTSREFFAGLGAARFIHLDALTDTASLDLLRGYAGARVDDDETVARDRRRV